MLNRKITFVNFKFNPNIQITKKKSCVRPYWANLILVTELAAVI